MSRVILQIGAAGAVAVLLLALPKILPPAIANEEPARTLLSSADQLFPPRIDPDQLLKWDFTVEPGVSTEPLREHVVKKISHGRTSYVRIVETETGVYSSDGMLSPHVQYPGITKERRSNLAGLAYWTGKGWRLAFPFTAGSFVSITPLDGGALVVTDGGTCVVTGNSLRC